MFSPLVQAAALLHGGLRRGRGGEPVGEMPGLREEEEQGAEDVAFWQQ